MRAFRTTFSKAVTLLTVRKHRWLQRASAWNATWHVVPHSDATRLLLFTLSIDSLWRKLRVFTAYHPNSGSMRYQSKPCHYLNHHDSRCARCKLVLLNSGRFSFLPYYSLSPSDTVRLRPIISFPLTFSRSSIPKNPSQFPFLHFSDRHYSLFFCHSRCMPHAACCMTHVALSLKH